MLRFNFLVFVSLTLALSVNAQNLGPPRSPSSNSSLDGPLFYQLLIGELNARSGDAATAFSLMLDAARKTNDPVLYQRAVEIALQARSGTSALQAAQAWRQALPKSKEANSFLFQILIGLNRINDTLNPLIQELSFTPESGRLAFIESIPQYYARTSNKKLAALTVKEALLKHHLTPIEESAAWTSIGRMQFEAEEFDSAIAAIRRAQALNPNAEEYIHLSLLLMRSNVAEAEALVLQHLDKNPTQKTRMDYARVLLSAQRFTEAQAQLQIMTTHYPDFSEAWLIQGVLHIQENDLNAAEKSITHYLSLINKDQKTKTEADKGRTQAYLSLAQIAEQRHDYSGADTWLSRIDSKENILNAQLRRAGLLAKQGNFNGALQLIRTQRAETKADARLMTTAEVQILRENKQYAAAYLVLRNAIELDPADWDLVYDLAMVAEKMGNMAEMERLLRSIIAAKPDYHHAYNALGYALADRGRQLPEAKKLILKALEYAKEDPFIMDSLGWVEFRSGNLDEALRLLRAAFLSKPDTEIAAHLGEVLWSMGQHLDAIGVWKKGLLIDPQNLTLLETLKRLGVKW